jgi:hypothetical protein
MPCRGLHNVQHAEAAKHGNNDIKPPHYPEEIQEQLSSYAEVCVDKRGGHCDEGCSAHRERSEVHALDRVMEHDIPDVREHQVANHAHPQEDHEEDEVEQEEHERESLQWLRPSAKWKSMEDDAYSTGSYNKAPDIQHLGNVDRKWKTALPMLTANHAGVKCLTGR